MERKYLFHYNLISRENVLKIMHSKSHELKGKHVLNLMTLASESQAREEC